MIGRDHRFLKRDLDFVARPFIDSFDLLRSFADIFHRTISCLDESNRPICSWIREFDFRICHHSYAIAGLIS